MLKEKLVLHSAFSEPKKVSLTESELFMEKEIINDLSQATSKAQRTTPAYIYESDEDQDTVDIDKIISMNKKSKKKKILESSFNQINSFKIHDKTASQLSKDVDQILNKMKQEEDVIVPIRMSEMKKKIRNEKKLKVINTLKNLSRPSLTRGGNKKKTFESYLPENFILEEEESRENNDNYDVRGTIVRNRQYSEVEKERDFEGKPSNFSMLRSQLKKVDFGNSKVESYMKKISIDSSIIKSLVGSRFAGKIEKAQYKNMKNEKTRKVEQKVTMLDIFKKLSDSVTKEIKKLQTALPSQKIEVQNDNKNEPSKVEEEPDNLPENMNFLRNLEFTEQRKDYSHFQNNSSQFQLELPPFKQTRQNNFSPLNDRLKLLNDEGKLPNPFVTYQFEKMNNILEGKLNITKQGQGVCDISCVRHSSRFYFFGTIKGEILEVPILKNSANKDSQHSGFMKKMFKSNNPKPKVYKIDGSVLTVDINLEEDIWAAGTSTGNLYIRKALGNWTKKYFKNFTKDGTSIIEIKFFGKSELIVATHKKIYRVKVKDLKVSFDIVKTEILVNLRDICGVRLMFNLQSTILAVGCRNSIHLSLLYQNGDMKYLASIDKPKGVEKEYPPVFHLMRPLDKNYIFLVAFWRNQLLLIKNEGNYVIKVGEKELNHLPVWSVGLNNQCILTVDEDSILRLETIEGMFITPQKKITLSDLNTKDVNYSAFGGFKSRTQDISEESSTRRVNYYGKESFKGTENDFKMQIMGKARVKNWKDVLTAQDQNPSEIHPTSKSSKLAVITEQSEENERNSKLVKLSNFEQEEYTVTNIVSMCNMISTLPNNLGIIFLTKNGQVKILMLSKFHNLIEYYQQQGHILRGLELCTYIHNKQLYNITERDHSDMIVKVLELVSQFLEEELPTVHMKGESLLSNFQRPIYLPDSAIETIISIVMDALLMTGLEKQIFIVLVNKLLNKGYKLNLFYRVVKIFYNFGLIHNIPLKNLVDACEISDMESLTQPLIFGLTNKIINQDIVSFQRLFSLLEQNKAEKNNWLLLMRMAFIFPEKCLPFFLDHLLENLEELDFNEIIDLNIKILSNGLVSVKQIESSENKNLVKFSRIFWFLSCLISSDGEWLSLIQEEVGTQDTESQKIKILMISIEWILLEKNFKSLCNANAQLLLELFYQLFLDYYFLTSEETTQYFTLFWNKLKKNLITEKEKYEESGEKMNSTLNPSASYFNQAIKNTEEAQDMRIEKMLPEYMNKEENTTYKLILLCIQSIIPAKYQIDFNYLFLKVINLSTMYTSLLQDLDWVKKIISKLISSRMRNGRFWLFYLPLTKTEFENEILTVFKLVKFNKEWMSILSDKAEKNDYMLITAGIIEQLYGPYSALRIHLKNFSHSRNQEIYGWMMEKLKGLDMREKELESEIEKLKLNPQDNYLSVRQAESNSNSHANNQPHGAVLGLDKDTLKRLNFWNAQNTKNDPHESIFMMIGESRLPGKGPLELQNTPSSTQNEKLTQTQDKYENIIDRKKDELTNLRADRLKMVELITEHLKELVSFFLKNLFHFHLYNPIFRLMVIWKLANSLS